MRFVAAGRIVIRAVNDLLKHQMPLRILGKLGLCQESAKILQMAVQIATDKHFRHILQLHNPAAATGRIPEKLDSTAKRSKDTVRVRHGGKKRTTGSTDN